MRTGPTGAKGHSVKTIGVLFLAAAIVCWAIQNTFYGYVDEQGFLHDSLFLPLGVLMFVAGAAFLAAAAVRWLVRRWRANGISPQGK